MLNLMSKYSEMDSYRRFKVKGIGLKDKTIRNAARGYMAVRIIITKGDYKNECRYVFVFDVGSICIDRAFHGGY